MKMHRHRIGAGLLILAFGLGCFGLWVGLPFGRNDVDAVGGAASGPAPVASAAPRATEQSRATVAAGSVAVRRAAPPALAWSNRLSAAERAVAIFAGTGGLIETKPEFWVHNSILPPETKQRLLALAAHGG